MKAIIDSYRGSGKLHHAYLIEGEREEALGLLVRFLEDELGFPTRGNPDYWRGDFETFGVDDSRYVSGLQSMRPVAGGRKVFVIAADSLTVEAQNSLLKSFEEPTEGTHFFLVVRSAERVLPTLRSRVETVRMEKGGFDGALASSFLKASPAKRADIVKPFIDDKDKSGALSFLASLERELRSRADLASAPRGVVLALRELEKARSYLEDRSPSVKQLLEHVANVVPRAD